ncbi:phosphate/phosphite/phosphonate ABC transporter substrate-binding protein [Sphaerotilus montanus]|uniref:Phosphonate transport system substrate-binding protein n=1 Tax=Sphaerotilus montanus TaxID=522889 RepID=A0A7Y9R4T3_9BURK|nr:phosphate/phosphite/phosphonate ABC transporter substrate-binding protein [Sphaerotilus montanus]NYG35057.1 phosphonate transport system substrate-binding protein [Sphaerotilus montanus]NZD59363.1 phosphate/phosphite/phosphonate ABC transporter substrate-binding protein [Sphaerotilus montanus]
MRRNFLSWLGRSALGATLGGGVLTAARAQAPARKPVRTLTVGIVPQQSASELARVWIPVLGALSERAGLSLRFATAPDIPAFEKRLAASAYDVAYMNPYHYSVFAQKPGYVAFAKEKGRRLRGLVVVRKDSMIKDMKELAGQQIAFPAPAAFAATVLVRAEFERMGVPITPVFVKSHESVYLNVAQRQIEAGGGIVRTLQTMDAPVRDELRVLWQTKDYTPHAFAAHPRVPAADLQALRAAMLTADSDPRMRSVLEGIGFKGFDAAQDAEWNDVRALGISTLAALLKE